MDYSECLYVGLPGLDAVQYLEGDNWLGVALSALMRIPAEQVAWLGAEALRRLAEAPLDNRRKFLLAECVQAYLPMTDEQRREFEALLSTEPYAGVQAVNVTVYEKGELKGLVSSLLVSVKSRFGREIPDITAMLQGFTDPEMARDAWSLFWRSTTADEFSRELARLKGTEH